MTAAKSESRLQRRIQGALAAAFPGCFILKVHVSDFTRAGTPDLLCCIYGLFYAFEVKLPGEKPTKLQLYSLQRINSALGLAVVVTSPEEAVSAVRQHMRESLSLHIINQEERAR